MKLKHVAAVLTLMSLPAFGTTLTVTNALGPVNTTSVVDNSGTPVADGYAGVGTFDEAVLATLSSGADLAGALTVFDSTQGPINNAPFPGTFGVSSANVDLLTAPGSPAGQTIYLVLGNAPDLANSSHAAVLRIGTFGNSEPSLSTINLRFDQVDPADIVFGANDLHTAGARNNAALTLLAVPEPSSSLLFGFAGLALLIRRKR